MCKDTNFLDIEYQKIILFSTFVVGGLYFDGRRVEVVGAGYVDYQFEST